MKYIGIDYGTKKIGVAVSDDNGTVAFPLTVVPAGRDAVAHVAALIKENHADEIVIGESRNLAGEKNEVMVDIEQFKKEIGVVTGLPTHFEREFFTSALAARQFAPDEKSRKANPSQEKLDASAAALILQSFLDKIKNNNMDEPKEIPAALPSYITIDDFKKVEIKVGEILSVDLIEGSDKLLKLKVNFGTEERQVLSGIKAFFPDPQVLVGKRYPFVTNLAPRKMMGLESQAMILAVGGEGDIPFALFETAGTPGARVR